MSFRACGICGTRIQFRGREQWCAKCERDVAGETDTRASTQVKRHDRAGISILQHLMARARGEQPVEIVPEAREAMAAVYPPHTTRHAGEEPPPALEPGTVLKGL